MLQLVVAGGSAMQLGDYTIVDGLTHEGAPVYHMKATDGARRECYLFQQTLNNYGLPTSQFMVGCTDAPFHEGEPDSGVFGSISVDAIGPRKKSARTHPMTVLL